MKQPFQISKHLWPTKKLKSQKTYKTDFVEYFNAYKCYLYTFTVMSNFGTWLTCFCIWIGYFKKCWSILCLEHFKIVLSMLEKQIWNHKFPQFWFTNFGQYSGLFGHYGLEGQTKGIGQILNTSWLQLGEKIMKIQVFPHLAFGATFKNFFGLFAFFWGPWWLRRSVVCKNPISEQDFTTKH